MGLHPIPTSQCMKVNNFKAQTLMTSSFFPIQFGADTSGVQRVSAAAHLNLAPEPKAIDDTQMPSGQMDIPSDNSIPPEATQSSSDTEPTITDFE